MDTKTITSAVIGAVLASGGTLAIVGNDTQLLQKEREAKHLILKDNIWKDARLGEIPKWDSSIVTVGEITQAYVDKANEEGANATPNLFENLKAKALEQGLACKI